MNYSMSITLFNRSGSTSLMLLIIVLHVLLEAYMFMLDLEFNYPILSLGDYSSVKHLYGVNLRGSIVTVVPIISLAIAIKPYLCASMPCYLIPGDCMRRILS